MASTNGNGDRESAEGSQCNVRAWSRRSRDAGLGILLGIYIDYCMQELQCVDPSRTSAETMEGSLDRGTEETGKNLTTRCREHAGRYSSSTSWANCWNRPLLNGCHTAHSPNVSKLTPRFSKASGSSGESEFTASPATSSRKPSSAM
jgi:hypothetical protein